MSKAIALLLKGGVPEEEVMGSILEHVRRHIATSHEAEGGSDVSKLINGLKVGSHKSKKLAKEIENIVSDEKPQLELQCGSWHVRTVLFLVKCLVRRIGRKPRNGLALFIIGSLVSVEMLTTNRRQRLFAKRVLSV